ncbi:AAA family ATPase, partial [Nanoarchaeota archaeon]
TNDKEGVTFADIGGLHSVIDKIQAFQYGIMYPGVYAQFAINPPKGLMLYGVPGNGKTMLAKALSNELEAQFAHVMTTDFVTKWVGEGEAKLESLIVQSEEYYQKHGIKVILFIDEADNLMSRRGQGNKSPVFDRCQTVLLRYMDGIDATQGIIYVAATNRIDIIDEAVLRPGRFDYVLEIPIPDRRGVLDIMIKQVAFRERTAGRTIYHIDNYVSLATRLYQANASGADIAEVLRLGAEMKTREIIEAPEDEIIDPSFVYVSQSDLEGSLDRYVGERMALRGSKAAIGFRPG